MHDNIAINCLWEDVLDSTDSRGWRRVRCIREGCGRILNPTPDTHDNIFARCRAPEGKDHAGWPGFELKLIFAQLRIAPDNTCKCAEMIRKMNAWGPDACLDHLQEIVAHLRTAYAAQSWLAIKQAQLAALTTGLAWELDWTDPLPSLVRLAVARARQPR